MARAHVCKSNLYVSKIDGILRQSHVDAYPCPVRINQNPDGIEELLESALAL